MGKESGPKIKTKEEQEQERIKEIIEMGEKLNLITNKAINAGLRFEEFWGTEARTCSCSSSACEKYVCSSFNAGKNRRDDGINFWSDKDYYRSPEEAKHDIQTYLKENIFLDKNKIIYWITENSTTGKWGAEQEFSFTKNGVKESELKNDPSNYEFHKSYPDGPEKLSIEEAEERVHVLLSGFLKQADDIIQKAKKELE